MKKNSGGSLHPRNLHGGRYDFKSLCGSCPELNKYIRPNPKGDNTIDFSDSAAVLCLNKALLSCYYNIETWQIPEGYLCPPIPGRADYIHYAADLLANSRQGSIPEGAEIKVLDIGCGANCIYPLIGSRSYGWRFTAADIDPVAVKTARIIVESNPGLSKMIKIIQQKDKGKIFEGIIRKGDKFDLTICNPPFHASPAEAAAGTRRKWENLNGKKAGKNSSTLNFGGQNSELWCPGGELGFLKKMAAESTAYASQVSWFTSLVSKADNIRPLKKLLTRLGSEKIEVIKMQQGQKTSRFIAWSFFS